MRKTLKTLAPAAAAGLLVCGLAATFAGPATAAAPTQVNAGHSAGATSGSDVPGSRTHRAHDHSHYRTHHHRTHHRSGKHRHKGGPRSSLGSSTGIHLFNNSVDTLVLTDVSGPNEGLPPVGSVLAAGVGSQDFEVLFRAFHSTSVSARYDVYDPTNIKIGYGVVTMSNDAVGDTSVDGTFVANSGYSLPLMTATYGNDWQVQSTSSAPITLDASSPTAVAMLNDFCNTKNTNAKCTFTPSSRNPGKQMHLLAEGYTIPGGGNTPGTVSVSSGYSASTATSWSVTVTAQMEMADVFSAGISGTYGQTVTWQNTFTAGESIPVEPGYTGYIWGNSPVIDYTGTMQIKLGNTTYTIVNVGLATPDPSRKLSDFATGTYLGNDPLHSPDQPPASAVPLP